MLFKYNLNRYYRDTYFASDFFTTFFISITIIYNDVNNSLLNIGGNFFSMPYVGLIFKVVIKKDPICIPTIFYCLFY